MSAKQSSSQSEMHLSTHVMHWFMTTIVKVQSSKFAKGAPLRILDIGCGVGKLMAEMHSSALRSNGSNEVFGFDISDQIDVYDGQENWKKEMLANLNACDSQVDWRDRVKLVSSKDPFPFDDESIDIAVANQVLEHVFDHEKFFRECARVLRGCLVASFPVKECFWEGHVNVPFVHWFGDRRARMRCLKFFHKIGVGNFRGKTPRNVPDLAAYQEEILDYLEGFTNYKHLGEIRRIAKANGLEMNLGYSPFLYSAKLRQIFKKPQPDAYPLCPSALNHWVSRCFFRFPSSLTFLFEKKKSSQKAVDEKGSSNA